ncbi:MAG: hypothetical protein K2H85_04145 [Allobaculum sp.]|nr:hypothetical protein [Allobaculum sp.]
MNDQTEKIADEICDDLEIAFRLDPTLPLPLKTYDELTKLLHRENKLKGAIEMDQEAVQYRTREVYHIFEDVRVVAPGTAERSYDPVTQSVFLMAPYTDDQAWTWLIQASKQPSILPNYSLVMDQKPTSTEDGNVIWMYEYQVDGSYNLDAVIREDENFLYIHALAKTQGEMDYLKQCVLRSGFYR